MEVKIYWSELSERQLKDIFDYYSIRVNPRIARRITTDIVKRVSVLKRYPLSGQTEELLSEHPEDFRYLVEGNYKIIYWIKTDTITIASVFDCRQNPEKIIRL